MNNTEYNAYIKNYLDNDKTKSAIMLIAPWGMGKSYYIQNSLIPYLEEDGGKRCVVVSLYGMNDVKEISKAIYLEIRANAVVCKGEKYAAGKIVGKTILKGVLSKVGIDLSLEEQDLEKLYSSIDLTDRLIILEDLERSGINIKQVLGYVNNLVEQDGAKVLLVANEKEIRQYEPIISKDKDGKETTKWVYTAETEEYLKIKEKTVSDTIPYLCNYDVAIENIIKMFSDFNLCLCLKDKDKYGRSTIVLEIKDIMDSLKEYNLRSLIFACQKTVDIFANYTDTLNIEFFRYVLLGNIAFALRLKNNDDIMWNDKTNPNDLGTSKYPLHEFCYEYIKYQELDVSKIKYHQEAFLERQEFEKKQKETRTALSILYEFHTQNALILGCAIEAIREELKGGTAIPVGEYGKLANYLIAVRGLVENQAIIDECKEFMLKNLQLVAAEDSKLLDKLKIHDRFGFWEETQTQEYNSFMDEMTSVFQKSTFSVSEDDAPTVYLGKITHMMCEDDSSIRQNNSFMERIDINKIIQGLEIATAEQVSDFRQGILSIYRVANVRDFLPNDKDALIKLQEGVKLLLDEGKGKDKVVQLQYSWLISNLQTGIDNY